MTLYHFGNCVAVVYVPYYMIYKYSGLSEYGAFPKCIQAAGMYTFTQLCKMLILATFFDSDLFSNSSNEFNWLAEFLRCSVDVADFLGFSVVLSHIPGKGHSKLITAGLGWAAAEVVLSRGIMLWVGARGTEFSWIYIQKSLESNIMLIQHISTATLIWMFSRHDLNHALKPLVTILLIITMYKGMWQEGISHALMLGAWSCIIFKAFVSTAIGIVTLFIYVTLAKQIGL